MVAHVGVPLRAVSEFADAILNEGRPVLWSNDTRGISTCIPWRPEVGDSRPLVLNTVLQTGQLNCGMCKKVKCSGKRGNKMESMAAV